MAIGTGGNLKIYEPQLQSGIVETSQQMIDAWNAASNGAIRLTSNLQQGNVIKEGFFQNTNGLVTRRDITSVAAVADIPVNQGEIISVKLNRKVGPVAMTRDAFVKAGLTSGERQFDWMTGTQIAQSVGEDELNTIITALRSALVTAATTVYTVPSNGLMNTQALVQGLAKYGDAAARIVCWVMHSKPYYDLVTDQIASKIFGISNFNIASGTPVTLNRPVLVTDSPALAVTSGSPAVTDYYTLGLVVDAARAETSEDMFVVRDMISGIENISVRMQAEYAYTVGVRGFTYDLANGGINPTNTTLGTGTNWDQAMTDKKNWAGVVIKSR